MEIKNEDKIPVGGFLDPKTPEKVLGSAASILDEEKGLRQSEVNANTLSLMGIDKYDEFSTARNYDVGKIVQKNDILYVFVKMHKAGNWNPEEVQPISLKEIDDRHNLPTFFEDNYINNVVKEIYLDTQIDITQDSFQVAKALKLGDIYYTGIWIGGKKYLYSSDTEEGALAYATTFFKKTSEDAGTVRAIIDWSKIQIGGTVTSYKAKTNPDMLYDIKFSPTIIAIENQEKTNSALATLENNDVTLNSISNRNNYYIKGLPTASFKSIINGVDRQNENLERSRVISLLNSFILSIDSVNYDGYLTFGLFSIAKNINNGIVKDYIYLSLYYYDDADRIIDQSEFDINTKHNIVIEASELVANKGVIYDGVKYSSSAIKIVLDYNRILKLINSFVEGDEISYDARKVSNFKYADDGFKPLVYHNNIINGSLLLKSNADYLLKYRLHESIKRIDIKSNYKLAINQIAYSDDSKRLTIYAYAALKTDEQIIPSSNNANELKGYVIIDPKSKEDVVIEVKDSFNKIAAHITINNNFFKDANLKDFDLICKSKVQGKWPDNTVFDETYYPIPEIENIFNDANFAFYGFFNKEGFRDAIEGVTYRTFVLPINEECTKVFIYGNFDKNGNVALANKNGRLLKWCITDSDGKSKYSGDETRYYVEVIPSGYKYLVISTKSFLSDIRVYAANYDKEKAYDSYNTLRFSDDVSPKRIGLFDVQLDHKGNVYTSCDRDVSNCETLRFTQIKPTFNYEGKEYDNGTLLTITHNGTKFYFAIEIKNDYRKFPVIWTEDKNGIKKPFLVGGQIPNIIKGPDYPDFSNYTFMHKGYNINYGKHTFIKELFDGELLIGLQCYDSLGDFDTSNHTYYVIFKTRNNWAEWVPKVITSNEAYIGKDGKPKRVFGYPSKNNSIFIEDFPQYDKKLVLISEYGSGTPEYWNNQNPPVSKNGNGVVGKMWLSVDDGNTFYKIFDFSEKINYTGNPDVDNARGNWKWVDSYDGRMSIHIHGCCIDKVNNMIWMTNGDAATKDGVNGIYYMDIGDLIGWIYNNSTSGKIFPVDIKDFDVKYKGEMLPPFVEYKAAYSNEGGGVINKWANCIGDKINFQSYCIFPIHNCILMGNDTARETIYGIHSALIKNYSFDEKQKKNISKDIFLDIFAEFDKDNPNQSIIGFPQMFFRRDENSPILCIWENKGILASWNGVDWKLITSPKPDIVNIFAFQSFVVKDTDGKYIVVNNKDPNDYKNFKIENY